MERGEWPATSSSEPQKALTECLSVSFWLTPPARRVIDAEAGTGPKRLFRVDVNTATEMLPASLDKLRRNRSIRTSESTAR